MLNHDDLSQGGKLQDITPLRKVPAFVTDSGLNLFESFVILSYLEDRFGEGRGRGNNDSSASAATAAIPPPPRLVLDTPDERAFVQLLVRQHDIYISSPNCTQPHFSHTQGCMYLDPIPTKYTPARRTMPDPNVRASKLKEIYERLCWLEESIGGCVSGASTSGTSTRMAPYMAGERITHADITWYPTCIFMEVLLPFCFDWSPIFYNDKDSTVGGNGGGIVCFPRLTKWFQHCSKNEHFASVRKDIYDVLTRQKEDGRFDGVRDVVQKHPELKWKYI